MEHVASLSDLWQAIALFFEDVDVNALIQKNHSLFYTVTFIWAFLEGETFLIFAGAAAADGALDIKALIFFAWMGSFIGDQIYFGLGRRFGPGLLTKFPAWQAKAEKVFTLIKRNDIAFILTYRFLWGVRTVSSFALGISGLRWRKFIGWNLLAALIWATAFALFGFIFGEVLDNVMGGVHEVMIAIAVIVVLTLFLKPKIARWIKKRRRPF